MTPEQIKTTLEEVLNEIQEFSGRSAMAIDDTTCPVGGLAGFDSINAVEAAAMLTERLGYHVDSKVMLPASRYQLLSIRDIVDRLSQTISVKEGT